MSDAPNNAPKAAFDPGWNDPPTLEYNSTAGGTTPGRTKLNLNKRVAFPMQSPSLAGDVPQKNQSIKLAPSGLPMPFATISKGSKTTDNQPLLANPPSTPPPIITKPPPMDKKDSLIMDNSKTNQFLSEEESPESALIMEAIKYFGDITATLPQPNEETDVIIKRLGLLKHQLDKDILNGKIKWKIVKIADELRSNNSKKAQEIYRSLMVDHLNSCTTWGSALNRVILTIESRNEENGKDVENNATENNFFVPATTGNEAEAITDITASNDNDIKLPHSVEPPKKVDLVQKIKSKIIHL